MASVLLSTMEEMKEEQEKKDKLVETKKEKAVVGQIPAGDKKEKEVLTVREKSSNEADDPSKGNQMEKKRRHDAGDPNKDRQGDATRSNETRDPSKRNIAKAT